MRTTRRIGVVTLIAVAGATFGVGLWIGAQLLAASPRVLASTAAIAPERDARALDREPTTDREPTRSPGPAYEGAPAAAARVPAAAMLTERPPAPATSFEPDAAGTSSIAGSVVTLDGAPLAAVELELEPPSNAPKYRQRRTTSDADGRFEFAGLPEGVWDVTGQHANYLLQRKTSYPTRIPTGSTIDFIACPGVGVEVHVTGAEAERARVAFRRADESQPRWSSWTPESSRIVLLPGAWKVCAFVDPLEDWPSDRGWKLARLASLEQTVQVGTGQSQSLTLELASLDCLYGTLKVPEGHQSNQSRPRLKLIEPQDGTRADFLSEGDRVVRSVNADEQGRFGLFRLPYERWTAGVTLGWGNPAEAETVEVRGLTRIDFTQLALGHEESVVVDAFSPAGQRITDGLRLSLVHRNPGDDSNDSIWHATRTVLEEGGSLRVIALPMEEAEAKKAKSKKELVLRASMAGFAVIDHPLSALNGERVRLSFVDSAEVEIVLVGEGALRAMRKCGARLKGDNLDSWESFDEAEGAIEFVGVHPGTYSLALHSWTQSGDSWRQDRLYHAKLDVQAGFQRLEIPMPIRADLVVRCPGVKEDVEAVLVGLGEDRTEDRADNWGYTYAEAKVDATGQVQFENVLAGTYRLTIGSRMQLVRVPGPTVDFDGAIPERFMFRLEEGDSPLRRAGIRSGDVFVAIDGEELGKEAALQRLQALSSLSGGSLKLTVERADRRLDFVLEAGELKVDEPLKASLEPDLEGGPR